MSISMERFGSTQPSPEPFASGGLQIPVFPYRLQCRACGFEPVDAIVAPAHCQKCGGHHWERFARPRSLLMNADRCAGRGPVLGSSSARADALLAWMARGRKAK